MQLSYTDEKLNLPKMKKKQKTYIDQKSNTLGKVYTVRKN